MERTDYIETRENIVSNIKTLYSYLHGRSGEDDKKWAIDKLKRGKNMVVEVVNDQVCFGPSRFVGYQNNTRARHDENHGNGTDTDNKIKQFYRKIEDERLDVLMQSELSKYGESSADKKYWISNGMEVEEILLNSKVQTRRYWVARLFDDDYWCVALENNLWLMQQRYDIQANQIVTQLLNLVKEVKVGDVLLLTYPDKIIYAYGYVVKCPYQTDQNSNLENIISKKSYDFDSGIVCFEDAEAFYEDLREGTDNWGQRISVDSWHYYTPDSTVGNYGCGYACIKGQPRQTIFEVDAEFGQSKMKELEIQYNKKNMFVSNIAKLLLSKHNIILQGAPGTGKTYNTAAIALKVLGITDINLSDHKAVMKRYDSLLGDQIFFTTFHQSFDYEDFVEGLKPHVQVDDNGNSIGVTYESEDGIFKRACNAAQKDFPNTTNKPVVLIIDEINRGNVSKIFGELISLLESDKRTDGNHPLKVMLPYTKAEFGVPSNLYIIGTMNTTDRSTGILDYALRRRFAFVTLKSQDSVIKKCYSEADNNVLGAKAVALFKDIKKFIENPKHLCGDMSIDDLMVGHSYFMAKNEDELLDKVEYEIVPLINEYINDGILNVKCDEKKIAFDSWCSLTPIPEFADEDDEENK